MNIRYVAMLDTGIGKSQGYANDAEFMEAAGKEREEVLAMLSPETRRIVVETERRMYEEFIYGTE